MGIKPDTKNKESIMILARNVPGYRYDQDVPAGYLSWLDLWQRKTNCVAGRCRCCGSFHKELVGAHVEATGYAGLYIIPLCRECNSPNNMSSFYVPREDFVRIA